ncbi:MAG: glutamyl-tRNA reductase [Chitinophagaceae bacterium]|nr:glutamyl-tRNA reductase [Chitinophagaceae bacterium]
MYGSSTPDISRFQVAGINYKKTDAFIRGQYAVSPEKYELLLAEAARYGVNEVFVLSTCNRTEIYGVAPDVSQLIELLCSHTEGDEQTFTSLAYIKSGHDAIEHLFNVSAGLDSQILGDYEIVGQIKQAVKFSKERSYIGAFTERLVNSILQSSKTIKNTTELSGGTVSVSFSAVQYLKQNVKDIAGKSILLTGTGKIGRNTCKNLLDYLPVKNITLVNRTDKKAATLAEELGVQSAPFSQLAEEVKKADIILVATNSQTPTILARDLEGHGSKIIIDLSIPYNVELSAQHLPGIVLVNVDELSRLKDKTLHRRKAEVPKAKKIIAEQIGEFLEWHEMRKHVPVLRAVKSKLQEIHINPDQERIQKVINGMAVKMRRHNQRGCHYIEAINEFMAPGIN